jgi:hypothetical protein
LASCSCGARAWLPWWQSASKWQMTTCEI